MCTYQSFLFGSRVYEMLLRPDVWMELKLKTIFLETNYLWSVWWLAHTCFPIRCFIVGVRVLLLWSDGVSSLKLYSHHIIHTHTHIWCALLRNHERAQANQTWKMPIGHCCLKLDHLDARSNKMRILSNKNTQKKHKQKRLFHLANATGMSACARARWKQKFSHFGRRLDVETKSAFTHFRHAHVIGSPFKFKIYLFYYILFYAYSCGEN